MSAEHADLIQQNFDKLVQNISVDDLANKLYSEQILTKRERNRIKSHSESNKMRAAEKLLTVLENKHDKAFTEFVRALLETEQQHLAALLIPELGWYILVACLLICVYLCCAKM